MAIHPDIGISLTLKITSAVDFSWENMNIDRQEFVKWFDKKRSCIGSVAQLS